MQKILSLHGITRAICYAVNNFVFRASPMTSEFMPATSLATFINKRGREPVQERFPEKR